MKKLPTSSLLLLVLGILGAVLFAACSSDDLAANDHDGQDAATETRPLVEHTVTVALSATQTTPADAPTHGANHAAGSAIAPARGASRVAFSSDGASEQGLQLSWEASETLGVYIRATNGNLIYAGTVSSTGTAGDRGARRFSGTVSEKYPGEQYLYLHPALPDETRDQPATGHIDLDEQTGTLGSTAHLANYLPLVWHEGTALVENHGYVLHLTLTFTENPGAISSVALQTMPGVGNDAIFPAVFEASTIAAGSPAANATLKISPAALATDNHNGTWTAEAYIACTHQDIDVFRTKFDVKVEATNGDYYNEFRSFPGQQEATSITGLPMLANGKCYNLATAMSKGTAPTVISDAFHLNSLLGMWNVYGKTTDPFAMVKTTGLPTQLTDLLGDAAKQAAFTERTLVNKSSQGSPTFTWDMVTQQIVGNGDGYKQANVTYNNINIVGAPTEVFLTFISEYAWSQNLLGYYHYPTGSVPANSNDILKTIIFPNVSKPGHVPYNKGGIDGGANINPNTAAANVGEASQAPLTEYTTVQLLYNNPDGTYSTLFPAGTTIGFFMMRDSKASSSGHDEGTMGDTGNADHSGYTPRPDNTLLDWTSWRLFTNTAWNGASGNTGWWNMNCQNFFCSADVGNVSSDGVIPGLALYGAKDDASHNYNYSFSAMLYMVSTSVPASMQTANKCYFNAGAGAQIVKP